MNNILILAGREFRDGLRNRWVMSATLLLTLFALTLALLGSAPTGEVKTSPLAVTVVSLSSLSIFLLPLMALLLSHDAVVGDIERGTMALLLSYPVARTEVLIGKYLGHLGILALATLIGYGIAGLLTQWVSTGSLEADVQTWLPWLVLMASSILLGACFLALGYLVSTCVHERPTAAGIAIGLWLFFVLIYDMAVLGILVADQGRFLTPQLLSWLLTINPADVYRLINLTGFADTARFSGMAALSGHARLGLPALSAILLAWTVLPFVFASLIFQRKQL
ncbi:MAG: ABC transporter permease subunit [Castellaniella sp.]